MKFFDDIKTQLPMEKLMNAWSMAKGKVPLHMKKTYAGIPEAKSIIERINYFLKENGVKNLGKQEIFTRTIKKDDGSQIIYSYTVDFNDDGQIKRLKDVLIELVDLTADDASSEKKNAIPGYLDYIAMASA